MRVLPKTVCYEGLQRIFFQSSVDLQRIFKGFPFGVAYYKTVQSPEKPLGSTWVYGSG